MNLFFSFLKWKDLEKGQNQNFYNCNLFGMKRPKIQGVPRQTVIIHFALAGRNMQASLGLKVIWEF